ncbi:MAG: hypothetical protein A3H25_03645 [Sphingomonadales bacterium RIFCSPLOWO2_12_FULL_63_15]|nr:MAG: hypothetical protein A3H25_03645 [Sphingomonadales bacterium RIFCSPLOWO2_12_FULL_63_15]
MGRLLLSAMLVAAVPTAACASNSDALTIYCDGGRTFLAKISPDGALVTIGRRTVALKPRPSSLGRRFDATDAALIIDGDMVALVLDDDIDFRNCRANAPGSQLRNAG